MAGQGPSRRELLEALALASVANLSGALSRWSYALAEGATQRTQAHPHHVAVHPVYSLQFFSPDSYRTVEMLTDLILPPTRSGANKWQPGAKDAGAAEFIDFTVFSEVSLQAPFQSGLSWLDQASTPAHSFSRLAAKEQVALLNRLAYKANYRDNEIEGQQFFRLIRKYTVMGFYTTRAGLESLDFPGLTFYGTSPGCTHKGNPEHVGL